MHKLPFERLEV